jgi:hypothetical protein
MQQKLTLGQRLYGLENGFNSLKDTANTNAHQAVQYVEQIKEFLKKKIETHNHDALYAKKSDLAGMNGNVRPDAGSPTVLNELQQLKAKLSGYATTAQLKEYVNQQINNIPSPKAPAELTALKTRVTDLENKLAEHQRAYGMGWLNTDGKTTSVPAFQLGDTFLFKGSDGTLFPINLTRLSHLLIGLPRKRLNDAWYFQFPQQFLVNSTLMDFVEINKPTGYDYSVLATTNFVTGLLDTRLQALQTAPQQQARMLQFNDEDSIPREIDLQNVFHVVNAFLPLRYYDDHAPVIRMPEYMLLSSSAKYPNLLLDIYEILEKINAVVETHIPAPPRSEVILPPGVIKVALSQPPYSLNSANVDFCFHFAKEWHDTDTITLDPFQSLRHMAGFWLALLISRIWYGIFHDAIQGKVPQDWNGQREPSDVTELIHMTANQDEIGVQPFLAVIVACLDHAEAADFNDDWLWECLISMVYAYVCPLSTLVSEHRDHLFDYLVIMREGFDMYEGMLPGRNVLLDMFSGRAKNLNSTPEQFRIMGLMSYNNNAKELMTQRRGPGFRFPNKPPIAPPNSDRWFDPELLDGIQPGMEPKFVEQVAKLGEEMQWLAQYSTAIPGKTPIDVPCQAPPTPDDADAARPMEGEDGWEHNPEDDEEAPDDADGEGFVPDGWGQPAAQEPVVPKRLGSGVLGEW